MLDYQAAKFRRQIGQCSLRCFCVRCFFPERQGRTQRFRRYRFTRSNPWRWMLRHTAPETRGSTTLSSSKTSETISLGQRHAPDGDAIRWNSVGTDAGKKPAIRATLAVDARMVWTFRGYFFTSLFMVATLGAAFCALAKAILPLPELSIPAFAMVGMAAMVRGGTGAAMTAVSMIFEMTRDYDIVMPMIITVAVSIGIRRLLSRESIYTINWWAVVTLFPRRSTPTCSLSNKPLMSWTANSCTTTGKVIAPSTKESELSLASFRRVRTGIFRQNVRFLTNVQL